MDLVGVEETPRATTAPPVSRQVAEMDRRRPGRIEVSQALLPLLRAEHEPLGPTLASIDIDLIDAEGDDMLAPSRGIGLGLLLSVPLWALIAACVAAVIR